MKRIASPEELFQAAQELIASLEGAGHPSAAAELREGFRCLNGLTDGWALFLESLLRVRAGVGGRLVPEQRQALERLRAAAHAATYRH